MLFFSLILPVLFGSSLSATIDAATGQVVDGSSTDLSKCLICNTAVTLPTPKCGMDANKLVAMQSKADLLAKDIAAIEASGCCGATSTSSGSSSTSTSGSSSGTTSTTVPGPQVIGYSEVARPKPTGKPGDGYVDVTIVQVSEKFAADACFTKVTLFIDPSRVNSNSGLRVMVFTNSSTAYTGSVCSGLVPRCSITLDATRFANKEGLTEIVFTSTEVQQCKPKAGELVGWYTLRSNTRHFITYSWVQPDTTVNYCMQEGTGVFVAEPTRANREYSVKFHSDKCTA